jgi:hypothetical protein
MSLGIPFLFSEASLERYSNLNGDSGVTHYSIGPDVIRVQFQGPTVYVYDYTRPGQHHVDRMKALALAGRGLATYISQHVQKAYARKE